MQLAVEGAMLGIMGAIGGAGLAIGARNVVAHAIAGTLPSWMTLSTDWGAIGAAASLALGAVLLSTIWPAWRMTRADPGDVLRSGWRGRTFDPTRRRFFKGLMTAQVSLALVLLVSALLAIKSVRALQAVDPGVKTAGALTFQLPLRGSKYESFGTIQSTVAEILERLRALHGVTAAAMGTNLPLGVCCTDADIQLDGAATPQRSVISLAVVSPGYFAATGLPIRAGRVFDGHEPPGSPAVIVSASAARTLWGSEDVVGKRLHRGRQLVTVVGVVGDVHDGDLRRAPQPQLYVPHASAPWTDLGFVVRAPGRDSAELTREIRTGVQAVDADLPMFAIETLDDRLHRATLPSQLTARLFAAFAGVALLLALAGAYGLSAYYTTRRTKELGLRIALGASRPAIVRLVLSQVGWLTIAGLSIGAIGSVAATRALSHVFYGVGASDPVVVCAASSLLAITMLIGAYGPSRHATVIDPARTLRDD